MSKHVAFWVAGNAKYVKGISIVIDPTNGRAYKANTDAAKGSPVDLTVAPSAGDGSTTADWVYTLEAEGLDAVTDQFGNSLVSATDSTKIIIPLPGPSIPISRIAFEDEEAPTSNEVVTYINALANTNRAQNQKYKYTSPSGSVHGLWSYNVDGSVDNECCGGTAGGDTGSTTVAVAFATPTYQCFDNNAAPDLSIMGHWTTNITSIKTAEGAAYTGNITVVITDQTAAEIYNSGSVAIGTDLSTVGTGPAAAYILAGSNAQQGGQIHLDKMGYALANNKYYADHAVGLPTRTVSTTLPETWNMTLTAGTESATKSIGALWWPSLDNATRATPNPSSTLSRYDPDSAANSRNGASLGDLSPTVGGLYAWMVGTADPTPWPFATAQNGTTDSTLELYRNSPIASNWQFVLGSDILIGGPVITSATYTKNNVVETVAVANEGIYDFIRSLLGVEANGVSFEGVQNVDRDAGWLQLRNCEADVRFDPIMEFELAASGAMVAAPVKMRLPIMIGF